MHNTTKGAMLLCAISLLMGSNLLQAQTPGTLDRTFLNFQLVPQVPTFLNTEPKFIGRPDIRTAVVQPDGKIVIGGNFIIQQEFIRFTPGTPATVQWKNIARLNVDGTLDRSFISTSAARIANTGGFDNSNPLVWGPDQPVYSITVQLLEDSYQYIVAGDFLNFSHNSDGVSVPRLRYLVLTALFPESDDEISIPLVELSAERSENFSFDSAVRKVKLLDAPRPVVDLVVANAEERVALTLEQAPYGFIVLDADTNRRWQRVPPPPVEWILLPPETRGSYFFLGDFVTYDNVVTPHIVRVNRNGDALEIDENWNFALVPNARVNDVAVITDNNIIVGDFTSLSGAPAGYISALTNDGQLSPTFTAGTGFNARAETVGYQIKENAVLIGGEFTTYDGAAANYLTKIDLLGTRDVTFPQPNFGNSDGPNGPVRTIAVQPDGRALIAGSFTTYNGLPRSGIARIEPDGSLDTTFTPQGDTSGIVSFATDIFSGFTNASLINSPTVVGNFRNLFGKGYDGIARLNGGSFPVIWYQPQLASDGLNINTGGSTTLRVVATDNTRSFPGNPPPPMPYIAPFQPAEAFLYQWFHNGRRIPGAVNSTLNLSAANISDTGEYTVSIFNTRYSVMSQPARITVSNAFVGIIGSSGFSLEGRIAGNQGLNSGLGGRLTMKVNSTGAFSGRIFMHDPETSRVARHSITGQINNSGFATVAVPRENRTPLVLTFQLDMSQGPDYFELVEASTILSDGIHIAMISGWSNPWTSLNPATAFVGRYNIGLAVDPVDRNEIIVSGIIQRPKTPQGEGYLSMVVNTNGQARLTGTLPDGTKLSMSGVLSDDANPLLTLWAGIYRASGVVQGFITIQNALNNPVLVDFTWSKPAGLQRTTDFFGFDDVVLNEVPGSGLYNPASVDSALLLSSGDLEVLLDDGAWTFANGGLAAPIAQDFNMQGRRIVAVGANPNLVQAKIKKPTGMISGTFNAPDQFGQLRKVKYSAMILTAGVPPVFSGFYVMPSARRNPAAYIGGDVSGSFN